LITNDPEVQQQRQEIEQKKQKFDTLYFEPFVRLKTTFHAFK